MANEDIRKIINQYGLKYWEVANEYGISDGNFSRKLRFELNQEEKDKLFRIIYVLANKKG